MNKGSDEKTPYQEKTFKYLERFHQIMLIYEAMVICFYFTLGSSVAAILRFAILNIFPDAVGVIDTVIIVLGIILLVIAIILIGLNLVLERIMEKREWWVYFLQIFDLVISISGVVTAIPAIYILQRMLNPKFRSYYFSKKDI
jgi:hypothetical protein